jgi:hypothetical protein
MNIRVKSLVAGLAAAATALTVSIAITGAADATATPPWEPDTVGSVGTLTLYDASGNVITGGTTTSHPMAAYAVASGTTTDIGANKFAHLSLATPDGTNLTYNWASEPLSADTSYPVGTGPAAVTGAGASVPVVTGKPADFSFADYFADFPNTQVGAQAGLYQMRLITPSTAAHPTASQYFSVDILVTGSTWAVVYPAPAVKDATSVAITAPTTGSTGGGDVTVTAHVADTTTPANHPTGSVDVKEGATTLASAAVDPTTGNATAIVSGAALAFGSHTFSAAYVATGNFTSSSTTTSVTYTATLPAPSSLTAPSIGAARVGVADVCTAGTWLWAGGYAYSWKLDAAAFASTATTVKLPATALGHKVSCTVVASNPTGSTPLTTAQVTVAPGAAPIATTRAKILGTPKVGKVLTASKGVWTVSPVTPTTSTYAYVWKIGSKIVSKAATYKPIATYKGKLLTLTVSAVRGGFLTGVSTSLSVKIG